MHVPGPGKLGALADGVTGMGPPAVASITLAGRGQVAATLDIG